jgi:hypothetical protein
MAEGDVQGLITALRDVEPQVRCLAVEALGTLNDRRAVDPLIALLKDESYESHRDRHYVQRRTIGALADLGDARAVQPLIPFLAEDNWALAMDAAKALGQLGDAQAIESLAGALQHEIDFVREAAAWALGNLGDEGVVEALIDTLQDDESQVRQAAVAALESITGLDLGGDVTAWQEWWENAIQSELPTDTASDHEQTQPEQKPQKEEPSSAQMRYMQVSGNDRDPGYCSDDACPCGYPGATIPRGQGYIYVSEEVVDFRQDCLTEAQAQQKIQRLSSQLGGFIMAGSGVFAPILMCEQGARRRGIDLKVAAADAKHWWQTGEVPLRATPRAK